MASSDGGAPGAPRKGLVERISAYIISDPGHRATLELALAHFFLILPILAVSVIVTLTNRYVLHPPENPKNWAEILEVTFSRFIELLPLAFIGIALLVTSFKTIRNMLFKSADDASERVEP